jgi:type II secretory pathway pseudopilin PulG
MTRFKSHLECGFTFVELLILLAVISILFTGGHKWYANHTIRTKVEQAISVANTAKTAIAVACAENPAITTLTKDGIGHAFPTSEYVHGVIVGGPCTAPTITVYTDNTGVLINPTLTLTGAMTGVSRQLSWTCVTDGLHVHVPNTCKG